MDVDTGGAADSDDEYSAAGGGAAAAAAAPRRSRRATAANPLGVTQGGAMRFEHLPTAAYASIGAHSRLRDLASLARTGTVGRDMAAAAKQDAAAALLNRVRRAVPAPYIYKYRSESHKHVDIVVHGGRTLLQSHLRERATLWGMLSDKKQQP